MIQGSRTFLLILLILQTGCEKSDTPPETSTKVDTGAELSIEEQISWEYDHGKRLPRLFRNERFSASIVASAANRYIAMGEDSAIKELKGIAENEVLSKHDIKERIGWICRILYRGDSELLRRPGFGALSLPYLTMLDTDWPLYPVVYSGNSYFILARGYSYTGRPETAEEYIEYCKQNGTFRTDPLSLPNPQSAREDLAKLRSSTRWKKIKWKDARRGTTYTMHEEVLWGFLFAQAN